MLCRRPGKSPPTTAPKKKRRRLSPVSNLARTETTVDKSNTPQRKSHGGPGSSHPRAHAGHRHPVALPRSGRSKSVREASSCGSTASSHPRAQAGNTKHIAGHPRLRVVPGLVQLGLCACPLRFSHTTFWVRPHLLSYHFASATCNSTILSRQGLSRRQR